MFISDRIGSNLFEVIVLQFYSYESPTYLQIMACDAVQNGNQHHLVAIYAFCFCVPSA